MGSLTPIPFPIYVWGDIVDKAMEDLGMTDQEWTAFEEWFCSSGPGKGCLDEPLIRYRDGLGRDCTKWENVLRPSDPVLPVLRYLAGLDLEKAPRTGNGVWFNLSELPC